MRRIFGIKVVNLKRVGRLGRVKPTVSVDKTPKSICEQDSELITDKFMGGREFDSSFRHEIGENPGED
jgi:hypothetical protein